MGGCCRKPEKPLGVQAADQDEVIKDIRLHRKGSAKKSAKQYSKGEITNAEIKPTQVETDAELLAAAQKRAEGVKDVVKRANSQEYNTKAEQYLEADARTKHVLKSKRRQRADSKRAAKLMRRLSDKVVNDKVAKTEKVKELEESITNDSVPITGYMDVETPMGIDKEVRDATIKQLDDKAQERIVAREAMERKIGDAANDTKHFKTQPLKKVVKLNKKQQKEILIEKEIQKQQEAKFGETMEIRLAAAKLAREEEMRREAADKAAEEKLRAQAQREAEEKARAEAEAAAAAAAAEQEAARKAEEDAKAARLSAALKRVEQMNAAQDGPTPWLAGAQQ